MKQPKREPIRAVEEKLTIDSVTTQTFTKQELIEAINKTFPDTQVYPNSKIATLTETKLRDRTKMQTITLGLFLQH